jgi:hypothetical protein
MAKFKILPLNNTPARRVTTSFAGKITTIRTYYNQTDQGWFADFYNVTLDPIVVGRALLPGFDLIRQFPDLDLGNLAYRITDNSEGQGFEDLGDVGFVVSRVE